MQKPSDLQPEDRRVARGKLTRQRVVDSAERLFSEHGYDGVSIRDIAADADVTLGVVGFHCGSKEELFHIVLARRVDHLSAARLQALEQAAAGGDTLSLRAIMDAYIAPYMKIALSGDPQWRAYARLIANLAHDDRWLPHIQEFYDPVAAVFLDAVRSIRPGANDHRLAEAFVMAVSCMLGVAASRARVRGLVARNDPTRTTAKAIDAVVDFCTAGMDGALGEQSEKPDVRTSRRQTGLKRRTRRTP